jgi:hypothetical protein
MALVNAWVIGLNHCLKFYNPDAQVLTAGQFLWEKQRLVMLSMINYSLEEKQRLPFRLGYQKIVGWYKMYRDFAMSKAQVKQ